ncbi:PREDICTED: CASP-like protein 4A3 isoform X2 [Tarenaya hassleriana]|uniref:CASP-like protein 4A3 isoform X2 n=1 Tax=Tarenaya hassleriana TaxID=28532 RepID=UPI00053C5939|nr:PREDICTED: CASP-like protein 4A3 isoform X2 [Tarenaya hassleriana]
MKRPSPSSSDLDSPIRSESPVTPPYESPALSPAGSLVDQARDKEFPLGSPDNTPPSRSPDMIPEKPWTSSVSTEKPQIWIDNSMAIVAIDKSTQFSPSPSPPHSLDRNTDSEEDKSLQDTTQTTKAKSNFSAKEEAKSSEEKNPSPVVLYNRSVKEGAPPVMSKSAPANSAGAGGRSRPVLAVMKRTRREELVKFAALGFRLSEVVLGLISFSIMAADKTQGWSGDSFDRYKEYRYCLSVNVIAFVYSGFQACDLAYYLVKEKHLIHHHLRPPFDFIMDQVLAYLLISASSAAATRVDDWVSNWGRDEFTEMASASVAMSFLAFLAFAFSSLISEGTVTLS